MSHQPLNIHAGTQIVTKVGVHGSNNALVHPRGAVGIVTPSAKVASPSTSAPVATNSSPSNAAS